DLQSIPGVRIPIDTAQAFVVQPLRAEAADDPALGAALDQYTGATSSQQDAWTAAYSKAFDNASVYGGSIDVPAGASGPVAMMMVLTLALVLLPFIPGVRSIPRMIPLYRLIWRDYYKDIEGRA